MNAARSAALITATLTAANAGAQTYTEALGPASTFERLRCSGPCDCAEMGLPRPMTGSFVLTFDRRDMWTDYYTVSQVSFDSSTNSQPAVHFSGSGTYHIGGDFALTHRLTLDLMEDDAASLLRFDSGEVVLSGQPHPPFPAVSITVTTGDIGCSRWTFAIDAAPGQPACPPDLGGPGGQPGPDGTLDNNDFIAFINAFFDHAPGADTGGPAGRVGADGQYDNNDFIAFITLFFQGC